jgi:hypothetical protein
MWTHNKTKEWVGKGYKRDLGGWTHNRTEKILYFFILRCLVVLYMF